MLKIFTPDNAPRDAFLDTSELFDMTRLDGCNADKAIISGIDRGWYISSKVCSALDAGINALSMIIRCYRDGSMIIHDLAYPFDTHGEDLIDVFYKGYRFTSFERFATYMREEWPYDPELDVGVESCL